MKKLYVFFMIFLVLFVVGCKKKEVTKGPFVGGTEGLSVRFKEGAPLSGFNQGEPMLFRVIVSNKGEYDVKKGDVEARLFGVNPGFGLSDEYVPSSLNLQGISQNIAEGGEIEISLGEGRYTRDIVNSDTFDINAMICYKYQTQVRTDICMGSRRIGETEGERVCEVQGEKIDRGEVSAAPIEVTSVTESFVGSDKIGLKIQIENKGKGDVYDPTIKCEDQDPLTDKDIIHVDVASPNDIECTFNREDNQSLSSGFVTLNNGVKILNCKAPVAGTGSNYQDDLRIKLDYRYVTRTSKAVTVYEA